VLASANKIFRILVKTLAKIGLITPRTEPLFNVWFDVRGLAAEREDGAANEIAEQTTAELCDINRSPA
jgi:hypothetical protein